MESLENRIKYEVKNIPLIEDVGFADVMQYHALPGGKKPEDLYSDARVAIIYISTIEQILTRYGQWYVVSLINFLKRSNEQIITVLKNDFKITAIGIIDEHLNKNLLGKVSFRQLAVLAGLGSIGKNGSLIHPHFGPRVCIGVVLADATLQVDSQIEVLCCNDCCICIEKCPTGALLANFIDRQKCKNRRKILKKGCSIPCLNLCPIGDAKGKRT